jgi:hypothetical protein
MIEQQSIDCAVELIRAIGHGDWSDIRWELQGGGVVLLLSVNLRDARLFRVDDQKRKTIVAGLNKIIPLPARSRGPHWMVVFVNKAEVIDSIYDWPN